MNTFLNFLTTIKYKLFRLRSVSLLLLRIILFAVFTFSGWGKLNNLEKTTAYFKILSIPLPYWNALLVGLFEFVSGIFILIGLFTRLFSIPIIIIMSVALYTAILPEIHGFRAFVKAEEFIYIALCLTLLFEGAGIISIDALLSLFITKQKN